MSTAVEGVAVDLAEYTGFLFRRAQQTHVAAWQREVSTEISSVQFGLLNVLANRPGLSQRDLGDALDLDRSTIADIVVRLQRRGLIRRVRDEQDRRRNVLDLTETGRAQHQDLVPRVRRMDQVLTEALTPQQREELMVLLGLVLGR